MKHTLIVGGRNIGKSTLIQKLLADIQCPVYGFQTKKEEELEIDGQGSPVYIYDLREPKSRTAENLLGYCKNQRFQVNTEVFNRFAPRLRQPVPAGSLILMDEIGFMESQAEDFCAAILELLEGDVPVLAVVKDKDTEFLKTIRSHPKARCFWLTAENREVMYPEVLTFLKGQMEEGRQNG